MFTNDDELAAKLRSLAFHGKGETQYDNIHVGMNSRLDTLQAAILIEKLAILEDEMVARQKVAARYAERARRRRQGRGRPGRARARPGRNTRSRRRIATRSRRICRRSASRRSIYYVKPLHQQVAYRHYPAHADRPAGFGGAAGADPVPADARLSRRRRPGPHHRRDPQLRVRLAIPAQIAAE